MITRRVLLGTALAAPLIMPQRTMADTTKKIAIAVQPGLSYAPIAIAKENRWIEDALPGVEVEWKTISSSVAIREAMLSGHLHVGAGSIAPFLIGRDRGFKAKAISVLNTVDLWLVTNNPEIKSIKDIKPEHKIAVPAPDTNQAFALRKIAAVELKNPRALDGNMLAMPHPDALQAVLANQIAAYMSSPPFQERALARGARKIGDSRNAFGALPFIVSFATEEFGQKNPAALRAIREAFLKGLSLVNGNRQDAASFLSKNSNGRTSVAEYAKLLENPETKFSSSTDGIEKLASFMYDIGFLRTKVAGIEDVTFKL